MSLVKISSSPLVRISNNIDLHDMARLEGFLEEQEYLGPGVWVMSLYDLCLTDPRIELTWWNQLRHPRKCAKERYRRELTREFLGYVMGE